MYPLLRSRTRIADRRRLSFLGLLLVVLSLGLNTAAQQAELTLADLLIGLRSKKVTLEERNTILAEAVKQRGITFILTPEIEQELVATGAGRPLIEAIKARSAKVVVKPSPAPVAAATPVPTPTPPDFNFYKSRADGNLGKGEFALALADYDKAVSLKPDSAIAFLNRGKTYFGMNDLSKAGADFDKAIELDAKDSKAFFNRGSLREKQGDLDNAAADYQKAVDLDASNSEAKAALVKVNTEIQAKLKAAAPPAVEPVRTETPAKPEYVNLGNLSSANAIKMVKPIYAQMAQRSQIEGRVVVEVSLDEEGNVTAAKAVQGHQFLRGSAEDAARRSKFKPAMFNGQPIRAAGVITYNFSLKAGNE
jgi:TonB family protein